MFDCIIIGAGPAGATAAYHLAKRGHSVLVLEKDSLPRYKPCGGGVSPAIAKWFDFDFTPVINNTITKVQYTWKMADPVEAKLERVEPMWMVQRDSFDHFLMQQAQRQGAQLQDNTEVIGIQFKQDCWQVKTPQETFSATYLIAADGVKGPLANWLGFKSRQKSNGATLEVKTLVPTEFQNMARFDFGSLKNGYIWSFPKADGYTISAGYIRGQGKPQEIKQPLINYATHLGIDLSNSQYSEYPLSLWTDNQPLHTDHAVLAGEAAGILDPLSGEGIRPAIFTGLKASEAIYQALTSDRTALSKYTQAIHETWGADMILANRLAGLFYQFPKIAYKVGVKRPTAAQVMARILCGELSYSDVTDYAIKKLKKSLIPGTGK